MPDSYWAGYQAGLEQEFKNPHPWWSAACLFWQLGNTHGHQVLCAALEHIATSQD